MNNKKTVFLDANILYSWNLNHLVMFFCDTGVGLLEPYWSQAVVGEAIRNIQKKTSDDASSRFKQMNMVHPYASVEGYEKLKDVGGVDGSDQHVAKAAIYAECDFLLTNNIRHFQNAPALKTRPKALTPDSLFFSISKKYPMESIKAVALAWWHKHNAGDFDQYLVFLGDYNSGLGLASFEKAIRSHALRNGFVINQIHDYFLSKESKRY